MQRIFNFIIKNKTFLLFLCLFSIAVFFTIQSHSYHKSKFINSANFITGGVYNSINNMNDYLRLKSQNKLLAAENNRLKSLFFNQKKQLDSSYIDTVAFNKLYKFTTANIIRNTYSGTDNVLLLNKGTNHGIKQDFGVITNNGIIGIIDKTSKKYATAISLLNTTSKISAQLKKSKHFGTLTWNGKNPASVQLIDIPKIAPVTVGDTIETSGLSSIFPKGIGIGTIKDFKLDVAENYYIINVRLFNDMTNIEHVYIIENTDASEINNLINNN